MDRIDVPVLIVGAGPVGLTGGILLARQGLASHVVERRSGPQRAPAAHVVNPRTLEVFRQVGLDMQAVDALAQDPADAADVVWCTSLAGEELGRLPFERQGDEWLASTPHPLRNLSQHRLEPLLLEHLRKTPGSEVHYGQQWEESSADADGVTSVVRDLGSGRRLEIRSRFLVAADGAGSRIRKSLGIGMQGPARIESFLMIHLHADLRPVVGDRPGVLYFLVQPGGGCFVSHGVDREWVYMHGYDSESERVEDYDEARCRAIVAGAIGDPTVPFEIQAASPWVMSCQVAERMRAGRIFLAGDAAHRFPPTGGLGLNTGVQDVHDLAWQLGFAAAGRAGPGLLDRYEAERLPVARTNAEQSLRNAMKLLQVPQALGLEGAPTAQQLRAALADPAVRARTRAAIADQAEHFDMLGLQLGFAYGREEGEPVDVRDYHPRCAPGHRLPHFWTRIDGERTSSLDLVDPAAVTLLALRTGEVDDATWSAAREQLAEALPDATWIDLPVAPEVLASAGYGPERLIAARPDQHVIAAVRPDATEPLAAAVRAALA